ncbi:MAG TPA: GLPGLI family protein [Chitinophagaceae bacterium]|nr:GLPGLI family protein [Chitinophagaceae bacterium]
MKKLFIIPMLFAASLLQAQTQFYNKVKIEFEKTSYVHAYMKDVEPDWYERAKEWAPKEVITYHEFIGDNTKSIFRPGREVEEKRGFFMPMPNKNIVYNDYTTGTTISQKPVFEETFLMQDSIPKIKWQLTADTRTIAGFDCRKAVGILDDSVGVIAYYTDELMIQGGPEGITGLPGMILGLSVPRLHTVWLATKVEVAEVNLNAVTPATKGKKVDRSTMMKALDKVLRQWGAFGGRMITMFEI